jgi:mannose-6-phosphate isomerase-like protein (cupin superfamily)
MSGLAYPRRSLKGKVSYREACAIPRQHVMYYFTGDEVVNQIGAWFYLSNGTFDQIVWRLPPRRGWRWPILTQSKIPPDAVYIVLQGVLLLSNPSTGEVCRVLAGEAAFVGSGTWCFGLSTGDAPVELLEYIGPPRHPAPPAPEIRLPMQTAFGNFSDDERLGQWPSRAAEEAGDSTLLAVRDDDVLWRLEGDLGQVAVGVVASTGSLTVGKMRLLPGQLTDVHAHGGDEVLYLPSGRLKVRLAALQARQWSDLGPEDGFYVPEGIAHQYLNPSDSAVEVYFGVSPSYRNGGSAIAGGTASCSARSSPQASASRGGRFAPW